MATKSAELLHLYKMVGAGNDFLFVNLFDAKTRRQLSQLAKKFTRQELAQKICRRHQGLGADGLIFIDRARAYDFTWDFYNSDGSSAEMCGNAARCVVRFGKEVLKIKNKTLRFATLSGEVQGSSVSAERTRVYLAAPKVFHDGLSVSAGGRNWTGTFLNAGVPQFVTEAKFRTVKDLNAATTRLIQQHKIFGAGQTNVTFIEFLKKNRARAVTFERGVEGFTLACGTGAIAAAYYLSDKIKTQGEVHIEMPGGTLTVSFDNSGRASLEGEALMVGEMYLGKEGLYGK